MKDYQILKKELLSDTEIRKAYEALGPEYSIIEKLIEKRLKQGMSQKQLAKILGTKQSAISRFESGSYNPTISFLYKIADALDVKLTMTVK
ncbi:MAG: helix-turn-helix transcriptional regulator [Patescibacteria group bacterium]|jgi:ribosome-binding protein aMBF1 (putative translation factor)